MRIAQFLDYSIMMKETIYSMRRAYIICQLENHLKKKGLTIINLPDAPVPADQYEKMQHENSSR